MSSSITTTTTSRSTIDSASALFELFESSLDSSAPMYQSFNQSGAGASGPITQDFELASKPRQVLGESVFNHFVKSQELNSEFPLGLDKIEVPELSPSIGTVTPLQLHSSIVESVFSPSIENSSPMFDDVELDTENWTSLFEPNELEIPPVVAATTEIKQESAPIPEVESSSSTPAPPQFKRSSSEAELDFTSSKRQCSSSPSIETDHLGVVAYNRKQRSAPLSPIVVESDDPVAQKRARNTEAARRSRARKMERMNQLEDKVEGLVNRNQELENEVARLRALLAQRWIVFVVILF